MLVYSLFDRKVKEYGALVLMNNDAAVCRALQESLREVKRGSSTIVKYPEDFDIMCVGEFDPESGMLIGEPVRFVTNVGEIIGEELEYASES